ncbi:hypothetical protein CON58_28040 [Bacillus pseudomycoides]|nr:hypothetical protein CON58_28040 [Bacillus pseudomycoides]
MNFKEERPLLIQTLSKHVSDQDAESITNAFYLDRKPQSKEQKGFWCKNSKTFVSNLLNLDILIVLL